MTINDENAGGNEATDTSADVDRLATNTGTPAGTPPDNKGEENTPDLVEVKEDETPADEAKAEAGDDTSQDTDTEAGEGEEGEGEGEDTTTTEAVNFDGKEYKAEELREQLKIAETTSERVRAGQEAIKHSQDVQGKNANLQQVVTALLEERKELLGGYMPPELTPEQINALEKEQLAEYMTRKDKATNFLKEKDATLEKVLGAIGNGADEKLTQNDADKIFSFAQVIATEDDKYFGFTSKKTTLETWNGINKMLIEDYGVSPDDARVLLVDNLDRSYVKLLVDLYNLRSDGTTATKAKPTKPKAKTTSTNNSTAKKGSGKNIGTPKNQAEIEKRMKHGDKMVEAGKWSSNERTDYVNLGKIPG